MVEQLEDWQVMFRVRRTVLEMLRDRTFEVDDDEITLTEEEYKNKLDSITSLNFAAIRNVRVMEEAENPEDEPDVKFEKEPILIIFAHDVEKIGKDAIRSMMKMMCDYNNTHKGDDSY